MATLKRSEEEIGAVLNECNAIEDEGGSKYPGMTYEQGVKAGIEWVIGDTETHPLDE